MITRATCCAALAAMAAAGCGDDEARVAGPVTVTETRTMTVTAPPTAAPAAPVTGASGAQSEPVPAGVVAADGTYRMKTKRSDYEGENIAVDDQFPNETAWSFATACEQDDCSIVMRRELGSGGFKRVTLHPAPGRPGVFEGTSRGTTGCATGEHKPPTRQRYAVKLDSPKNVAGRAIATRITVYFTERTSGCRLSKTSRGIVSWRGTRD